MIEKDLEQEIDLAVGHIIDEIARRYNLRELSFNYLWSENGEGLNSYSYDVRYQGK